jgi:signal transduction histidine kinase
MTGQHVAPGSVPVPLETVPQPAEPAGAPAPLAPPTKRGASGSGEATWWDRSWAVFDRWTPYALLAASAVMSLLNPEQEPGARVGTLVLVGVAAAWIRLGDTLAPVGRRRRQVHALVYLTGLLGLATLLMSRDTIFFVFAIAAFLQAGHVRPLPLVFVATGSTSLSILYFTWGGFPTETGEAVAFAAVLAIQTVLIGFGVAGGEKLAELSEERRSTLAALEATMAQNAALQSRLVEQARNAGVSEERQRLAREIHDTLAQGLTGIITQLEAAEQRHDDLPAHRRHVRDATRLARESLTEARRSVHALTPGPLEHARLPAVLREHVASVGHRHGLTVHVEVEGWDANVPAEVEVVLLRVAQEALANVVKHADASFVGVTLSLLDDQVVLDVRDDGRGFRLDRPRDRNGFGISSMRQRLTEVGGTLTLESEPGSGAAISAAVPRTDLRPTDA